MNLLSYGLTFIEGFLTFISPCILPMMPIYFFYLAGMEGDDEAKKNRLFINSIAFVIGFIIIFTLLGAVATTIGHFLVNNRIALQKISGIIIILFGLNYIGVLKISFLNMEKSLDYKFNKLNFFSSIIFGIVFGLGWSSCSGAFLGSALALASNSNTVWEGVLLLFTYSIGLGIPFMISAIIFEKIKSTFDFIKKHYNIISIISGIMLIIAGILVFTGVIKYL